MKSLDSPSFRVERLVALVLVCTALLQFAVQVGTLTRGVDYIVSVLTVDDTYYYLQTAWNTKRLGFPTFDGIHPTNGVQLLWFWMVVLIAVFAPTKIALLFVTLITCFLLNVLCYLIIWRLGKLLQRPKLSLYMSCLWMLLSFGTEVYSIGMENSLHAFVFWCMVWRATVFLVRVQRKERPNLLGLTVILILNAWTRMDAGLFSAVLYIYCIYCIVRALGSQSLNLSVRREVGHIVGSALLAISGLVMQLVAFQLMGGSWLPVSALIKSSWAGWGLETLRDWALLAACTILPPVGLHFVKPYIWKGEGLVAFQSVWRCLLIGVFLHLIPSVSIETHRLYPWYLSPVFLSWIIGISVVIDGVGSLITRRRPAIIFRGGLVAGGVLAVVLSGFGFAARLDYRNPLYSARYDAALWMAGNLPEDAICVSWNAGQIGFFSERAVINLDGLGNSADYYNRVLRGPVSVMDYIYESEADYIVDYSLERRIPQEFPLMQKFPVSDGSGREIQVWRVLPLGVGQGGLTRCEASLELFEWEIWE